MRHLKRLGSRVALIGAAVVVGVSMAAQTRSVDEFVKRVGPADEATYKAVRDARAWNNPFIVVSADHLDVYSPTLTMSNRRATEVATLGGLLMDLEITAWPYGRVVGLQQNGLIGSASDEPAIKKSLADVRDVLKSLQIAADEWPPVGPSSFPPPREIDDPEAYAVYAALMPKEWAIQTAHATRLLMAREGQRDPECEPKPSFSAPGFNADKTRALVYIAHSCGSLCGGGTHHFMVKDAAGWHEVRPRISICTWAS